jgi:hypothetical protein
MIEHETLLVTLVGRIPVPPPPTMRRHSVRVRRILYELRSQAIDTLNEQFKRIFDAHGQVPTKGLVNTRRFALGAVFVYQLSLWYRHEHGLDLRVGLKPFLKAA